MLRTPTHGNPPLCISNEDANTGPPNSEGRRRHFRRVPGSGKINGLDPGLRRADEKISVCLTCLATLARRGATPWGIA